LRTSVMVGDRESDADAGVASGCRAILIDPTGIDRPRVWCAVPDIASAAELVLRGWE
jgi:phosphoglycolate phosphatase-like HAD superfamily hydrolase